MIPSFAINARFRRQRITGVQRYAAEITQRLAPRGLEIGPQGRASGIAGHAWEQFVLPRRVRAAGGPLWSPCNTGPLAVSRQVVTIHDLAVLDHPEWFSAKFNRLYRFLLPRLARRAARIATVSDFSRNRIAEAFGIDKKKIALVYNGVSDKFRPRPAAEISAVRARYGLGEGPYFATLGTLEPRKNITLALKAWPQVSARLGPGAKLVVIGGGVSGSAVFRHAPELPEMAEMQNVCFPGYVPDEDLPAMLGGALALIYPSLYEGFGLPLLEAMACGTAVITTKLTSLPEVAGKAGLYTDAADPAMLAACMLRLAESPALQAELAGCGQEQARKFRWEISAEQMDGIISVL